MFRLSILVAVLTGTCCAVAAQNHVSLYDQCNYSGRKYNLEAGTYRLYQMKIGNDKLSSLQVPEGFRVTIYENDGFAGRSNVYTNSVNCLESDWRNMMSSVVVENLYASAGYGPNDFVTFYNDCYSRGYSQSLRPGSYTGSQLGALKNNLSSFVISGNLRVRLYINNENLSGYSTTYETNQACLPANSNDKVGSLVIDRNPNTTTPGHQGGYVTMYSECSYGGNGLRLMPGYYPGDKLGILKKNISSIQVPQGLRVKAFINSENLSGQSYTITDDILCMESNMRNRIASLVIEETGYGNNNGNNPYPGAERVVIYVDEDYMGQSAALLPGTYSTMQQAGFPDNALSSLTVPAGYRVVIYEEEHFKGKNYTITASKTKFYLSGWSDKTSSIAVYKN